jgi:2-methylcitrate dehydratase
LAARREPVFLRALKTFAAIGGTPECSVIGAQQRAPVTSAVMLNGTLIRTLDMNDAYVGHGHLGHPSDNIAVALSVGERQRSSGLDVVASVVVGYEIYCRIQDLVQAGGLWDHTTGSALVAPAIAARLLKLTPDQLAHALALSAAHGNTLAEVRSGQLSNAKATANGIVAMQATLCVLLAAEGVTGPMTVLEGRRGLNRGLLAGGDLNLLAEPIRERFRIDDVGIKPYPCIGTAQTMIAGVLQLRAAVADPVKQVKRVAVRMADVPLVSGQVADQDRRFPSSRESADHSFYFLAAAALADGE